MHSFPSANSEKPLESIRKLAAGPGVAGLESQLLQIQGVHELLENDLFK